VSRYMLINKGTNPYNGEPVTAVRVNEDIDLSWNGENIVAFGRGDFATVSVDFGWHRDADTVRDTLAAAMERAGTSALVEWSNTVSGHPYDADAFMAWAATR
jgi:hypothetical protein